MDSINSITARFWTRQNRNKNGGKQFPPFAIWQSINYIYFPNIYKKKILFFKLPQKNWGEIWKNMQENIIMEVIKMHLLHQLTSKITKE